MKVKKNRWKLAAAAVILAAVVGAAVARKNGAEQPDIRTAVADRGPVTASVSGNGILQPVTTVEVRSNVGGEVVELAVDEGDYVTAGQLIARIDPSDWITNLRQAEADFSSARAKVNQAREGSALQDIQTSTGVASAQQALEASRQRLAQAQQEASVQPRLTEENIKQARSNLAAAQANLEQTRDALIPQSLASAQAAYDQARASFERAQRELDRKKTLLAKGYVAQSEVDSAQEQYHVAEAQLASAKSRFDTAKQQTAQDLRAAEARAAQAQAALEVALANRAQDAIKKQALEAARASYKQAEAALAAAKAAAYQNRMKREEILQANAALERASAALKNARTQLGYTTITAPRSGVVVKKYVEKGSIVTAGRSAIGGGTGAGITLVEIADVTRMQVLVDVDETDIRRIHLGQEVDVNFDAYPDERFKATVVKIAPSAVEEQSVTTVPVTVELSRADSRLKPAMNATCDFITARKRNVLRVPNEAIKESDRGAMVMVLEKNKPVPRRVRLGIAGNDFTEIISGLRAGETVITAMPQPADNAGQAGAGPGGPGGARGRRMGPPMF